MQIKSVDAVWLHSPIAEARQHVSDFGRHTSFDTALVKIETDAGIVGWGEAKAAVGGTGVYRALVGIIRDEIAPLLVGRDPRDPARVWEALYTACARITHSPQGTYFPISRDAG